MRDKTWRVYCGVCSKEYKIFYHYEGDQSICTDCRMEATRGMFTEDPQMQLRRLQGERVFKRGILP